MRVGGSGAFTRAIVPVKQVCQLSLISHHGVQRVMRLIYCHDWKLQKAS